MTPFHEHDADHLRRAIELAHETRERGNAPFGAVLVGEDGRILAEGQNTVNTERDVTGHAETNLIRAAYRSVDAGTLAASTLYASAEPCAMCSGAIFWAGVGRVVYGLGADRLYEMFPPDDQVRADLEALESLGAEYVLLDTYYGDLEATRHHERAWKMLATLAESVLDLQDRRLR